MFFLTAGGLCQAGGLAWDDRRRGVVFFPGVLRGLAGGVAIVGIQGRSPTNFSKPDFTNFFFLENA